MNKEGKKIWERTYGGTYDDEAFAVATPTFEVIGTALCATSMFVCFASFSRV